MLKLRKVKFQGYESWLLEAPCRVREGDGILVR